MNWIKCSEKMPEIGVSVLAVWNRGVQVLFVHSMTGMWDDGDYWSCIGLDEVTHWMPLPQPPEE